MGLVWRGAFDLAWEGRVSSPPRDAACTTYKESLPKRKQPSGMPQAGLVRFEPARCRPVFGYFLRRPACQSLLASLHSQL